MSGSFELESAVRLICPLVDDYLGWQGRLMRALFYPDLPISPENLTPSPLFMLWRDSALGGKQIPSSAVDQIIRLQHEVQQRAESLLAAASLERPPIQKFEEFTALFEDLLQSLQRVERDVVLSVQGYDSVTGLRSSAAMMQDLGREMDRLSRRGRPFALAFTRIDRSEEWRRELGDEFDSLLRWLSDAFQKTLRASDDAYRVGVADFILVLKHTDMNGAERFAARMRDQISRMPFRSGKEGVTLSYCVAAPVPGENLEAFIEGMKADFERSVRDPNLVLQHEEISPLQRFLSETGAG